MRQPSKRKDANNRVAAGLVLELNRDYPRQIVENISGSLEMGPRGA